MAGQFKAFGHQQREQKVILGLIIPSVPLR